MTRVASRLHSVLGSQIIIKRLKRVVKQKAFIFLSLFGHAYLAFGTFSLYYIEHGKNPHIETLLDTLFWSVATVTTVGYGAVVPITPLGKVIGIMMMVMGSGLFWSYTALFATALIAPELKQVEDEVHDLERALKGSPPLNSDK
jgi:voltage-gated potassium channel